MIPADNLDLFWRTARERQAIYLRRLTGRPAPWTDDPIFQQYRFCNVYREQDRVTRWVDEYIRRPFAQHQYLWLMLAIARYINWPPTLHLIIGDQEAAPADRLYPGAWPSDPGFSPAALGRALEDIASTGVKVYTGAYMIRAESSPAAPWYNWSKHRYIAEVVIGRLWEDRGEWATFLSPDIRRTLQEVWERFQDRRYIGWGPFMAYEAVTDMRHTRYLREAEDINTWANAGPGAIRGLNRLHGRPLKAHPPAEQTCTEMREVFASSRDFHNWPQYEPGSSAGEVGHYQVCWNDIDTDHYQYWPAWEMREVEHWLCEFDKHQRVARGEGRPRSLFVPGRGC